MTLENTYKLIQSWLVNISFALLQEVSISTKFTFANNLFPTWNTLWTSTTSVCYLVSTSGPISGARTFPMLVTACLALGPSPTSRLSIPTIGIVYSIHFELHETPSPYKCIIVKFCEKVVHLEPGMFSQFCCSCRIH